MLKRLTKMLKGNNPEHQLPDWPKDRGYDLHLPFEFDAQQPLPLLVCLHGYTQDGRKMAELTAPNGDSSHPDSLNSLADKCGFAVVYPYGSKIGVLPGRCWNAGGGVEGYAPVGDPAQRRNIDDVQFFRDLLTHLHTEFAIDREQIYVMGISNGGAMAQRLAMECPELWRAVATVAGCNQHAVASGLHPTKPMPLLHIHGDGDTIWPYSGGAMKPFGLMASVRDSIGCWVKANSSELIEDKELPSTHESDPTRVRVQRYQGDADVELYTVVGGGHAWPGGHQFLSKRFMGHVSLQFQGNQLIWDFFQRQRILRHENMGD